MNKKIPILEIQDLNVSIKEVQILKNLNLIINKSIKYLFKIIYLLLLLLIV